MNLTYFLLRAASAVVIMLVAFLLSSMFEKLSLFREHRRRAGAREPELGHTKLGHVKLV
jgi:hypothetical protein